ncbi:MAG: hypothetical protein Q8K97_00220 [Pseudohongiella sp.]|nr:hypothetical protein [Pseudohongiella sp.]
MAITVEARNDLITLAVGMFSAAPGTAVLSDLSNAFESGSTLKQIATNLAGSAEYLSIYPAFMTNAEFAVKLVDNMVGSLVSAAGKADAVALITGLLNGMPSATAAQKAAARADVTITAINALKAVPATDTVFGAARVALDNKVTVATYHSVEKQNPTTSLAQLQQVIASVNNTDASVVSAKAAVDGGSNIGQTFNLTAGIDNLVGGTGNDTFNAVVTATSATLGGLDSVDGGAGTDTLNVTDTAVAAGAQFSFPVGLVVKNVENVQVATNGGVLIDTTAFAGLQKVSTLAAGTANTSVTAAATTDVAATVTGAATVTVAGGKAVDVVAGTGTVSVTGAALTAVSVKGGGATTINNTGATSVSLKSVTLDGVEGAAGLTGLALTTLNLQGSTNATQTTTITNSAPGGHAFTINASGAGIDKASATAAFLAGGAKVDNTTATALTINSAGSKNALDVSGFTAAKSLTIAGASAFTLLSGTAATVTAIDGSAATGALTLGTINTAAVNVKTGAGADSFTLGAAKVTVDSGAGNDTVTLGGAIAVGSSINLGAGNDKLLVTTGSVATNTLAATTVIDGGAGTDTVAAALINAGNAKQFINFEELDASATANLDVELMTGSTITGLTLSGGTGGATLSNVAKGVGLSVTGSNTGITTINVKDAALVSSTADTFAVTFAGTTGTVAAGTLKLDGVENVTLASGGTTGTNTVALDIDKLKTVAITGSKALTLTFIATAGDTAPGTGVLGGVTSIDGSAATGILTINTANVTAAAAGITINTGSAADVITIATKSTVNAGAGNDTITVTAAGAANGSTLTGGAGNDTFVVKDAVYATAEVSIVTITDFTAGADKITFKDQGTEVFNATKVDISAATNLTGALDIAAAGNGAVNGIVNWFQYGADTYIIQDLTAGATIAATDVVVKLTGLIDLSGLTVADFNFAA